MWAARSGPGTRPGRQVGDRGQRPVPGALRWAVAKLATGGLQVAVEVAGIAARPAGIEERAQALLEPLRRVVPFEAAWLGLLDPERREHVALAFQGSDDRIRARFASPAGVAEVELIGMHRARPPLRLRDSPVPPAELRGWAEYLEPAGFRETLAVGLFTPDGRHLGVLALHTDTAVHPTDAART